MVSPADFIVKSVEEVRKQVGDKKAVIGLSGGVDSSVAALLTHKAVGENLVSVFVDTGFMRKDEAKEIDHIFKDMFHLNFRNRPSKEQLSCCSASSVVSLVRL